MNTATTSRVVRALLSYDHPTAEIATQHINKTDQCSSHSALITRQGTDVGCQCQGVHLVQVESGPFRLSFSQSISRLDGCPRNCVRRGEHEKEWSSLIQPNEWLMPLNRSTVFSSASRRRLSVPHVL